MNYNIFLKKIRDGYISFKKNFQKWVMNKKKGKKNNSETSNAKSFEFSCFLSVLVRNIALAWRIILPMCIVIIFVVLGISLRNYLEWGKWNLDTIERKTSFVLVEIRKISELTTATYYEEHFIEKTKEVSHVWGLYSTTERLAVVVKGTVKFGYDLSTITERDITIGKDGELNIKLPDAKILNTIINDKDIIYGGNNDAFNKDDLNTVYIQAEEQLVEHAIKEGLYKKATDQGEKELTKLFNVLGFKEITFN